MCTENKFTSLTKSFCFVLLLFLLAGCGGKTAEPMDVPDTASPEPEQSTEVIGSPESEPVRLPQCTTIVSGTSFTCAVADQNRGLYVANCENWMCENVYEALTGFADSKALEPTGIIAESWTVSDDCRTWNFAIRDGISFSDGTLCDAEAVAACFNKVHKISLGFVSCGVKDGNIVSFTLLEPDESFAEDLTEVYVCSVSAMELYGKEAHLGAVGTGPYMLREYTETSALLKANPYYSFAPRSPIVEEIHLIIDAFSDVNVDRERFKNREIDYILAYGITNLSDIETMVGEVETEKLYGTLNSIWMNGDYDPRFKDRTFRLAISRFIDFDAISVALNGDEGWAVYGLWPEGADGYIENGEYYYDPEEGLRMLKEMGMTPAETEINIKVYSLLPGSFEDLVIKMLKDHGFKVNVTEHGLHWSTYSTSDLYESSLYFSGTTIAYPAAERVAMLWRKESGAYFYDNELYVKLCTEADAIEAAKTRAEEFEHLENITRYVQDDIATLGGMCSPLYIVMSPGFIGLEISNNVPQFYTIAVK